MKRYTREQRVIIVKNLLQHLLKNEILRSCCDIPYKVRFIVAHQRWQQEEPNNFKWNFFI